MALEVNGRNELGEECCELDMVVVVMKRASGSVEFHVYSIQWNDSLSVRCLRLVNLLFPMDFLPRCLLIFLQIIQAG